MLSRFMQDSPLDRLMENYSFAGVTFTRNPGHEYNLTPKSLKNVWPQIPGFLPHYHDSAQF